MLPNPEDSCHLEFWNFSLVLLFKIISLLFFLFVFGILIWLTFCFITPSSCPSPAFTFPLFPVPPWLIASHLHSTPISPQPRLISYFVQLLNFYFKSCIFHFRMSNLSCIFISNAQSSLQSLLPYLYIWLSFYFKQITCSYCDHDSCNIWALLGLMLFIVCTDIYSYFLFL